jgi:hypothetical protein
MSHCSRHTTGALFNFGRINTVKPIDLDYLRNTPWEIILSQDWDADGNTKWSGDKPALAFIKNNLILEKAAKDLGYACSRGNGKQHLAKRIRTRGIGRLLPLLELLILSGKMPVKCTALFKKRTKPSRLAIEFANEIISATFNKQRSRSATLAKLGIDKELVEWWRSRL